jgi:hypothetical protein
MAMQRDNDSHDNDRHKNDGQQNDGNKNDGNKNDGNKNDGNKNDGNKNDGNKKNEHGNDDYENDNDVNDDNDDNDDLCDDPKPSSLANSLQTLTMNSKPLTTNHTTVEQPSTYSTWIWDDSHGFAPRKYREASPLPNSVSAEYRAIDLAARGDYDWDLIRTGGSVERLTRREVDSRRDHETKEISMLLQALIWKEEQFFKALDRMKIGLPYRFLAPWSLELRMQCIKYRALLDRYYHIEGLVWQCIDDRLFYHRQKGVPFMEMDAQLRNELMNLIRGLGVRENDETEGNHFLILDMVLDEMETKLQADIQKISGGVNTVGGEDGEVQEVLTELPRNMNAMLNSGLYPGLVGRFRDLRELERIYFPSRFESRFERLIEKEDFMISGNDGPLIDRKRASPDKEDTPKKKKKKMKGGRSSG